MMAAGVFDSYFSTLVKGGIKGLKELAQMNPAFLYPYHWIWKIESFMDRLNKRENGYKILENLYNGIKLQKAEEDFISELQIGDYNVASRDESGKFNGLSVLGYIVLIRHRRGQNKSTVV